MTFIKKTLNKYADMFDMTYFIIDNKAQSMLYTNQNQGMSEKVKAFLLDEKILEKAKIYVTSMNEMNVITFLVDDFCGHDTVTFLLVESNKTGYYKNDKYMKKTAQLINLLVFLLTQHDVVFEIEQFFYDTKQKRFLSPAEFVQLSLTKEFAKPAEYDIYHDTYIEERGYYDAIRNGTPSVIETRNQSKKALTCSNHENDVDQIRKDKNKLIAVVTLCTLSAVEGGLSNEAASALNSRYIKLIEEMIEIKNHHNLSTEIMLDYAHWVEEVHAEKVSRVIYNCQSYISTHLFQKITVAQLAEILHLNTNYLSTKFKHETGISLSAYILKEKIEEAKQLIMFTDHDFGEISRLLHFADQSHFIKTFKKYTTFLPSEYRESNYSERV